MAESAAVTIPEGIWQVTTKVTPDPRVVTLHAMEHGLSEDAARMALMSGTGTSVVISTFDTALATQGEPGIQVTAGMVELTDPDWEPDYVIISRLRENERQCMAHIATLQADNAALLATIEMLDKRLGAAAFGAAYDLPDPPRRPDGTLAPQGKPWAPPKPVGDARRVGG